MKISVIYKYILLLIFLFNTGIVMAQDELANTKKECQRLTQLGIEASDENNYLVALEYFTKAEVIAKKNNWKKELSSLNNDIGMSYSKLSNYGEALGYYMKALKITKEDSALEDYSLSIMNNIGNLYHKEKDYITALEYYKAVFKLAKKKKVNHLLTPFAVNIADVYNNLGNYKEAQKYLAEVKDLNSDIVYKQMGTVNYAESLLLERKPNKAKSLLENLLPIIDKQKNIDCYVGAVKLLSKIYDTQHNMAKAISFAENGLQNNTNLDDRILLYNQLSELHYKNKQYEIFKKYKDQIISAKDSASTLIKSDLFESNKVKLKVQEYQNKLEVNEERQKTQRNFFIIIIVLSLAMFFFIYRSLHNRIVRQNQEKIIIQRNQEIINLELENKNLELEKEKSNHMLTEHELDNIRSTAELKQEQLKNQIAEKNRELSAKALYLSIRNELIEEAIKSLTSIPEVSKSKPVNNHIRILKDHLKNNIGWDDFINQFEKTNPAFLRALKEAHPSLNGKDIRFICCIFMNLDIKEISNIFNVTYNAANKRKQRIREKMGIYDDSTLYHYLLNVGKSQ